MRRVVFTQDARADVLAAFAWYDARQPGLGHRLIAELDLLVARMARTPSQFPAVHGPIQRGLLRRFPYGVFFRVLPDTIQILACLHTSRAPVNWQQRL